MSAIEEWLSRVDGLFVGLLTEDEQKDLQEAVKQKLARYSYEGAAGFMGLAKVRKT